MSPTEQIAVEKALIAEEKARAKAAMAEVRQAALRIKEIVSRACGKRLIYGVVIGCDPCAKSPCGTCVYDGPADDCLFCGKEAE